MRKVLAVYLALLLALAGAASASQNFDGTNDNLNCGSAADMDGFTALSICFRQVHDGTGITDIFFGKSDYNGVAITLGWALATNAGVGDYIVLLRGFSIAPGAWRGDTTNGTGVHTYCYTHDGSTSAPLIYMEGVSRTVTTIATPSGTLATDAAQTLIFGEDSGATNDFDGTLQSVEIDNAVFTAAEVNRHYWTGSVGRPVKARWSFYGGKMTNEGSATGTDCTASGSTADARIQKGWRNVGTGP